MSRSNKKPYNKISSRSNESRSTPLKRKIYDRSRLNSDSDSEREEEEYCLITFPGELNLFEIVLKKKITFDDGHGDTGKIKPRSKWIDVIVLGSGSKFLMEMKAKRFEQNRPLQTTDAGEELSNTPASTSLASKTSTQAATNHFSNTGTQATFQSHLLAPPEPHPTHPPLASVLTPTSVEPTVDETQKAYDELKVSIYPLYLSSLDQVLIKNE